MLSLCLKRGVGLFPFLKRDNSIAYFANSEKGTWLHSPSGSGGGPSPKRTKNYQNNCCLLGCLVLHKSLKGASPQHLKRPSCELFGALGPQKMHFTCMLTIVSACKKEKPACLHGFGALREQPGTQRAPQNARFPCSVAS